MGGLADSLNELFDGKLVKEPGMPEESTGVDRRPLVRKLQQVLTEGSDVECWFVACR